MKRYQRFLSLQILSLFLVSVLLPLGSIALASQDSTIKANFLAKFFSAGKVEQAVPAGVIQASFGATQPAKLPYSGIANVVDPSKILQGGDNIGSATVVSALPYSDLGTTSGYTDDYDETCPYNAPGSPDVVYSYTPAVNETIDISLCNSGYDTKLYLYENSYTPGTPYACNDDICPGYRSEIVGLALTGSNTYYIVVDGYGGDFGSYNLEIDIHTPVVVNCPAGGIPENEPCGTDANGGCNSIPPVFGSVDCGDTICGTAWADTNFRDTDWYQKVLTADTSVTWSVVAEFPVRIFILKGTSGCPPEPPFSVDASASPGDTARAKVDLGPGTWWFLVLPYTFDGFPCATGPHDYVAWLECAPPHKDPLEPDTAYTVCLTQTSTQQVIQIRLMTDNIGAGDSIQAAIIRLLITADRPGVTLDTTLATTFAGTALANWEIQVVAVDDPSLFPMQLNIGGLDFGENLNLLGSGDHLIANLVFSISEPTNFCVDTSLVNPEGFDNLALTTSSPIDYFPQWVGACCGPTPPPTPTTIPTLSEWGLIIFSLLLLATLVFYLHCKRRLAAPAPFGIFLLVLVISFYLSSGL